MPSPSYDFLSTRGIRVWIFLGMLFAALSAWGSWVLLTTRHAELNRFAACKQGTRHDCEPSFFWILGDLSLEKQNGSLGASVENGSHQEEKRAVRSSDAAPTIYSVRPEGVGIDGQGYRIAEGAQVTFTVNAQDASIVELFFRAATEQATSSSLTVMKKSKDSEGDFTAAFKWQQKQAGELEIRATGAQKQDQASLFIPISVEVKP